ncbi:MAG: choice-of-anchor D domain-containing protein, partial [Ignavibacteriaceae bacterium]|nr:choice-of-anchor D domain-containing protein [Ignavibacteriaceae bacterium]
MFNNFFKFFSVVFLLSILFLPQNSFAQQSEQQIIQQYLDGTLQITTQFQKDVVSRYIEQNIISDVNNIKPYISPETYGIEAIHFQEDFTGATGTTPPAGWQNVVNSGGNPAQPWQFGAGTMSPLPSGGGFSGNIAYLNSDAYGSGSTQNTSLITPSINLSTVSSVVISFSEQFRFSSPQVGTFSVSTNGGSTWTDLFVRNASYGYPNPAVQTTLLVPQAANQADVKFKWTIVTTWGYWWAIDNVVVRDFVTPAAPISFNATGVSATGMTIEWADNSTDETSFRVYRSTDNITFAQVGADIPSTTVAGTGTVYSQVQTGLSPSTLYYYRIVAVGDAESAYLTGNQSTSAPGVVTSVASGNWSSTSTWSGGVVPGEGDAVTISGGHTVTIDAAAVALNLTVAGVLEFEDATARTLVVTSNVTINNGGTFQTAATGTVTTHNLSIGGNLTNNGTFDLSTNDNTAGATLVFSGPNNSTVSGTGTVTDLRALTMSKSSRDVVVEINLSNFTVRGASTAANGTNFALLTSAVGTGTLKFSGTNSFDGTLYAAAHTIPATMGLWINNPNFTVNGFNGSITLSGLFRMTAGTYNIGTSTGNSMAWNANSVIIVEGGAINAAGRFGVTSAGTAVNYTQTGGVITVQTIGNASTTLCGFDLGTSAASVISINGATIVVQNASTGTTKRDYRFQSGSVGIGAITNSTLYLGNASTTAAGTFQILGVVPDLIIDGTFGHSVSFGSAVTWNNISRNITINPGTTLDFGNGVFLFAGSTLTNNGTLTHNGASSRFIFFGVAPSLRPSGEIINNGSGEQMVSLFADESTMPESVKRTALENFFSLEAIQSITGSGVFTAPMTSFEVQNEDNVALSNTNNIIANRVILFVGGVTGSSRLTLGNGGATTGILQLGNTTTPTLAGGFDEPLTFNLGTGGQTISYLRTGAPRTTGNEINPGRVLTTMTYDDDDVANSLTIAGGNLSVGTLNVTTGKINTNSSNLITVTGTTTTSIVGGSATAFVNGPLLRTLPASLVAGSTYNYPVGKGSYRPFALVDALTTADGPVVISAEVFDANSGGTPGSGMVSLNTDRYWYSNLVTGNANFTSASVKLTEDNLDITDAIAKSNTVNGTYNLISSTVPSGGSITSDAVTSLGYLNIGERFAGPQNPSNVTATAISSSQINLTFTPNGANNNVVIIWNTTGTFSAPSGTPVVGAPLAGGTVLSNGTTSPVNHTGLTENTTYYYKLFSYDGSDYSLGIDVNAITPFGVPYFQDFNASTSLPAGWTGTMSVLTNHGTAGSNGLTRNLYSSVPTAVGRTPFIGQVTATTNFEFDYRIVNYSSYPTTPTTLGAGDHFDIQVSTDNTNWTTIHTIDNSNHVTSLNFAAKVISLGAYDGNFIYVRISCQWANGDYYFDVDNVQVREAPTVPLFSINPVSKDFGSVFSGNTSDPQSFTITNTGVGLLTINSGGITLTGANADQFVLGSITYPIELGAGASQIFTVSFAPTSVGFKSATIEIVHNASGSPGMVTLTGNAMPAGMLYEDFSGTTFPPTGWLAFNNDGG